MTQPRGSRSRHRALIVLAGAGALGAICLPPLLLPVPRWHREARQMSR